MKLSPNSQAHKKHFKVRILGEKRKSNKKVAPQPPGSFSNLSCINPDIYEGFEAFRSHQISNDGGVFFLGGNGGMFLFIIILNMMLQNTLSLLETLITQYQMVTT